MKSKGVITAIIIILILGVGITVATRRFIAEKQTGFLYQYEQAAAVDEEGAADAGAGGADMPGRGTGAAAPSPDRAWAGAKAEAQKENNKKNQESGGGTVASEVTQGRSSGENMAEASLGEDTASGGEPDASESGRSEGGSGAVMEDAVSEKAVLIGGAYEENPGDGPVSPLTGISSHGAAASDEALTKEDYRRRLEEIDILVANMKESDVLSNTDSMSNIADYEYRLWDAELNRIYQAVIKAMTAEEAENLKAEERAWLTQRDQSASQAASKYKGGTMERLEYTACLAASTRTRTYELLEGYGQYLEGAKF